MKSAERTKKLVTMAMLTAMAYMVMVLVKVPVVLFLKYEPKDVILTLGALIYGAPAGLLMSAVVALIEMVTVSETGIIGCLMNFLSSAAFLLPVTVIYRKKRSFSSALVGLTLSVVFTTGVMLLWNYFITPLYMEVSRDVVAGLLVPAFLPFNLVKSGLNSGIILLLYKPLVRTLQRTRLLPAEGHERIGERSLAVVYLSLAIIAVFVLLILVMKGVI